MTRSLFLAGAALLALAAPASAAVSVLDSGSASACYSAARAERTTAAATAACDAALTGAASTRDLAASYANRSAVLLGADDATGALADADQALALDPGLQEVAVTKAGALLMLGRYAEARSTLDAALPHVEGIALERALFNRALANEALGDVKAAYLDFKRAAELNPAFDDAHVELARFSVK